MEKGQIVSGRVWVWGKGTEKVNELVAVKAPTVQSSQTGIGFRHQRLNSFIYNNTNNNYFLFCL